MQATSSCLQRSCPSSLGICCCCCCFEESLAKLRGSSAPVTVARAQSNWKSGVAKCLQLAGWPKDAPGGMTNQQSEGKRRDPELAITIITVGIHSEDTINPSPPRNHILATVRNGSRPTPVTLAPLSNRHKVRRRITSVVTVIGSGRPFKYSAAYDLATEAGWAWSNAFHHIDLGSIVALYTRFCLLTRWLDSSGVDHGGDNRLARAASNTNHR